MRRAPHILYAKLMMFAFIFLMKMNANAQFVSVGDPNMLSFLKAQYPTLINTSNKLDTVAAATITGSFDARRKNISNAYEVKYFKSLSIIYLGGNNLTSLPALKIFPNLEEISCDTNQITSMIPLNHLTNLKRLNFRSNKLTSLPSLAGLTNLIYILIDDNELTSLPVMTGCTQLFRIVATNNHISSLPNMSTLTGLGRLFLGENNFTAFPDLSMIPSLQLIALDHNAITSVPDLSANLNLTEIDMRYCPLTTVASLAFISAPISIKLHHAQLTFEDLIPMAGNPGFATTYEVMPQSNIPVSGPIHATQNASFTFTLNADNSVTTSTYYWYHEGNLISTTSTNSLTITPVSLSDVGSYYARIVNSTTNLSPVTLYSEAFDLIVDPCVVTGALSYNLISSADCFSGATIQIDETTLSGGTHPYHYTLSNQITGTSIPYTGATLDSIPAGKYYLNVYDATGCLNTFSNELLIGRPSTCDAVISPDGDGVEDSYFISISGKAKVYDKAGRKVRELSVPGYFDGTDDQGRNVPDGLYLILVDEKVKLYVTVLR